MARKPKATPVKPDRTAPPVVWQAPPSVGIGTLAELARDGALDAKPHLVYDAGRIVGAYFPLCFPSWASERAAEITAKRLEIEAFYVARWLEKHGPPR